MEEGELYLGMREEMPDAAHAVVRNGERQRNYQEQQSPGKM